MLERVQSAIDEPDLAGERWEPFGQRREHLTDQDVANCVRFDDTATRTVENQTIARAIDRFENSEKAFMDGKGSSPLALELAGVATPSSASAGGLVGQLDYVPLEIDIGPAQRRQLTDPQAGCGASDNDVPEPVKILSISAVDHDGQDLFRLPAVGVGAFGLGQPQVNPASGG